MGSGRVAGGLRSGRSVEIFYQVFLGTLFTLASGNSGYVGYFEKHKTFDKIIAD